MTGGFSRTFSGGVWIHRDIMGYIYIYIYIYISMSLVMEDEQIQEPTTDFGQSFGRVHSSVLRFWPFFGSCRLKHNWMYKLRLEMLWILVPTDVALLRMCHVTRHDSSRNLLKLWWMYRGTRGHYRGTRGHSPKIVQRWKTKVLTIPQGLCPILHSVGDHNYVN